MLKIITIFKNNYNNLKNNKDLAKCVFSHRAVYLEGE